MALFSFEPTWLCRELLVRGSCCHSCCDATEKKGGGGTLHPPPSPFSDKLPPVLLSSPGQELKNTEVIRDELRRVSIQRNPPSVSCHHHLFTHTPLPFFLLPPRPEMQTQTWAGCCGVGGVLLSLGAKEERKCILCATRCPRVPDVTCFNDIIMTVL